MRIALLLALVAVVGCGGTRPGSGAPSSKENLPKGDMTLKAFILQKPESPTVVVAECSLDTYYNFEFSNAADTHYSFNLYTDEPFAIAHAYAVKDSEHGRKLYEMLKDGGKRKLAVKLQRIGPDGRQIPAVRDNICTLVGIVE